MKKLIFSFCFLLTLSVNAQEIEWQKSLGGTGLDWGPFTSCVTNDLGIILIGITDSNDGDVSGNHGNQDVWIVKLDSLGIIEWQKCYGGDTADIGTCIASTSDGGYIAGGFTYSNNGDVSGNHGYADLWLIKLDSLGNLDWQKCFGGTGGETAQSLLQTADGGFVVCGETFSTDGDVIGLHGYRDFWVIKTDSIGNLEWQKCLGGSGDDFGNSMDTTADGGYVIAGSTDSNDGDVTGYIGSTDYWVVKLNSSGSLVWQNCLGGPSGWDIANSVQLTTDGGFILNGETISTNGDVTGNHGAIDYWVVKLDSTGNLQWQSCLGGTGSDRGHYITQMSDGGYLAAGTTVSNDGQVSGNHGGNGDFWIVRIDSIGILIWQKCFGGSGEDRAFNVHKLSSSKYITSGMTSSNDGDVSGNHGGYSDFWVSSFTDLFNRISGTLFVDLNSNGIHDTGETTLNGKKITEQNTGRIGFSQSNGNYYVPIVDTGNFVVVAESQNFYNTFPLMQNASFSALLQTDSLNDFAYQPSGVFSDLCLNITPAGPFRAGFNSNYLINYNNIGNTTINNCSIILFLNSNVTYVSSTISPFSITQDSIIWNIGQLSPFQTGSITATVHVNIGTPIGTAIYSVATIEPLAGDVNPSCNTDYYDVVTIGSYDPNDILVSRDSLFTTEFPNPPFLEYVIRFQNTGNDTAFFVKILNDLDTTKLQLNTLEYVASSHPVDMRFIYEASILEFKYNNILLPDSNINEPESHGLIRYRIKPVSTLAAGDTISNFAGIYFDFNTSVFTNTAITTVILPTDIYSHIDHANSLKLFPNPATNKITVSTQLLINTRSIIKILSIHGQLLFEKEIISAERNYSTVLDIRHLHAGMYILELVTGSLVEQSKFVKQ